MASMRSDTLVIRRAVAADMDELRRLAALDSAMILLGDLLVAQSDDKIHAAYSLDENRAIADPFLPTADLVTLLRTRADLLRGTHPTQQRHPVLASVRALPAGQ
jgi:hypothetical protein